MILKSIVFPTSVLSEAREKSEYLMSFRHVVYVTFRSEIKYQKIQYSNYKKHIEHIFEFHNFHLHMTYTNI